VIPSCSNLCGVKGLDFSKAPLVPATVIAIGRIGARDRRLPITVQPVQGATCGTLVVVQSDVLLIVEPQPLSKASLSRGPSALGEARFSPLDSSRLPACLTRLDRDLPVALSAMLVG